MKGNMEEVKKGIGFVYLSIIIHFYILFLVLVSLDPSFLKALLQMAEAQKNLRTEQTENVIVDTQTESQQAPEHGMLSDKPNPDSAMVQGKKNYNYLNLNPGKEDRPALIQNGAPKENAKEDKSGAEITLDKSAQADSAEKAKPSVMIEPSDKRTSMYDPDKKIDVTMDNYGEISLATIPKEYASYFLNMQKKIGDNWKEFFPVFQYYQGIIKSGEVVVRFQIDPDGNVRNAEVVKSYGYTILDESSLNAVNYSRNFGQLPKALRSLGNININFRFIYIAR